MTSPPRPPGRLAGQISRHRGVLAQFLRFGVVGVASTLIYSAVYLPLATYALPRGQAVLAVPPAFLVAVTCGYFMHSAWSFRGHGRRDNLARTGGRFVIVSLVSFALNQLWVWLLVQALGLPLWAPYPLVLGVTPLVVFALNRKWVFG